ncbi:MAG: ComEC/Rec2 family competence protein [Candidatus Pacebacteria bacterium]|nr:ComEC/Rec2 family competence protein [Candidatus Paceibacterota bacterium]
MKKKNILFFIGILSGLNILIGSAIFYYWQPRLLEITFFDVGQGDSIFIETPLKNQILIDGGPDSCVLERLSKEIPFWDRSLDLMVLTHPDHDHMAGLIEVLKSYEVENILWNGIQKDSDEFREWQRLIDEEGANMYVGWAGQRIKEGEFFLEIISPLENMEGKEADANNNSLVIKAGFRENDFLFAADISKPQERKIIERGTDVEADILKVAHHGSKISNGEEFLEKITPRMAVISCGKDNSYGHPHQETLDILKKYDIDILRTDLLGSIKIKANGKNYAVSSI